MYCWPKPGWGQRKATPPTGTTRPSLRKATTSRMAGRSNREGDVGYPAEQVGGAYGVPPATFVTLENVAAIAEDGEAPAGQVIGLVRVEQPGDGGPPMPRASWGRSRFATTPPWSPAVVSAAAQFAI